MRRRTHTASAPPIRRRRHRHCRRRAASRWRSARRRVGATRSYRVCYVRCRPEGIIVERLIVIIAIGESLVAIGVGTRTTHLDGVVIAGALIGSAVACAMWLAYIAALPASAQRQAEESLPYASGGRSPDEAVRAGQRPYQQQQTGSQFRHGGGLFGRVRERSPDVAGGAAANVAARPWPRRHVPFCYCTAERLKTRIDAAVSNSANPPTTARLSAAIAVGSLMPQIACKPLPSPRRP